MWCHGIDFSCRRLMLQFPSKPELYYEADINSMYVIKYESILLLFRGVIKCPIGQNVHFMIEHPWMPTGKKRINNGTTSVQNQSMFSRVKISSITFVHTLALYCPFFFCWPKEYRTHMLLGACAYISTGGECALINELCLITRSADGRGQGLCMYKQ